MRDDEPAHELRVLLEVGAELGPDLQELQRALEQASFVVLAEVGDELVRLLGDGRFGRLGLDSRIPVRVSLIEAILRAGYPWALQVTPEDLAYRKEERLRQQARDLAGMNRAWLLALATVVGTLWLCWPRTERHFEASETPWRGEPGLAPFTELDTAPMRTLHGLVARGVRRATDERRHVDALRLGLECLHEEACVRELARLAARLDDQVLALHLHRVLRPETPNEVAVISRAELQHTAGSIEGPDSPADRSARMTFADRASTDLSGGERNRALAAALECVERFPTEAQCHRVIIAGLDGHDRADRSREDLAWILLTQRQPTCTIGRVHRHQ